MTQKTRGTTIQQRFGFKDEDLKKPLHDEIMLWLDKNAEAIILEIEGSEWSERKVIRQLEYLNIAAKEEGVEVPEVGDPPPKPKPELLKKQWEYTVESGNFVVGFIDMALTYTVFDLWIKGIKWDNKPKGIESAPEWFVGHGRKTIFLEVKTSIRSLGELIRQIRLYQNYLKEKKFVVVSPEDQHVDTLESQGIGFIKYSEKQRGLFG